MPSTNLMEGNCSVLIANLASDTSDATQIVYLYCSPKQRVKWDASLKI